MTDDLVPAATPLDEWLDRLAERHGSPGGGAACAVLTAIAAALLGMVAAYTPDEPAAADARARVDRIRSRAMAAAEEDGERSAAFGAALAMEPGPERETAVRVRTVEATESSLAVGALATELVDDVRVLAEVGNVHVAADLRVAGEALVAALSGAIITARADLDLLVAHREDGDGLDERIGELQADVDALERARDAVPRAMAPLGGR